MSTLNRQQLRSEVRKILSFIRAMKRLREAWGERKPAFDIKVGVSPAGLKIVEGPAWTDVENLLSRFRPIYLDSERTSFRSVVRILPRHLTIAPGSSAFGFQSYTDLENRWDDLLNGTRAPLPAGTKIVGFPGFPAGYHGVSQEDGYLEIFFEGNKLAGREALDLSLYGVLVHVDQGKEGKRLRIQETFIEPGYRWAVMSLLAALIKSADQLRIYAEAFVEKFKEELGAEKLEEIEAEVDPPQAQSGTGSSTPTV